MEKVCCQVKCVEIDNGYRIEITGDCVKDNLCCCDFLKNCCRTPKNTDYKNDCC